MRVLIIDNYDSFTFNLYQLLGEQLLSRGLAPEALDEALRVVRNDTWSLQQVVAHRPTHIVLSPGPGHPATPRDFGVCAAVIEGLGAELPMLGVCLGHQGMVHVLGGRVVRAPSIVHGKTSRLRHDGRGLFSGQPEQVEVMRYHSWMAERESLPDCLEISAETEDGLIMAVRHRSWPLVGLQFHPESVGSATGPAMLARFLAMEAP